MRVEFHPATASDLNAAIDYYDARQPGLGDDCRSEIYRLVELIAKSPRRFPEVDGNIRRCFARRFPFSVLYRIVDDNTVRVLVIRHHRQDPSFGLKRE